MTKESGALRSVIGDPRRSPAERLRALAELKASMRLRPESCGESNNHIHTIYSFSPYTPAMAALLAYEAGLETAGSVDHDSVAAAQEMLESGAILGMGACVGFEIRVNYSGTPFEGLKLNNPDSPNMNYMTVQGIPRSALSMAEAFLKPIRKNRDARNREQTARASELFSEAGLGTIDYGKDVLPLSMDGAGGAVTERHILAALASRLIASAKENSLSAFVSTRLGINASGKIAVFLDDAANPHRLYDLLGLLKAQFLPRFFVQPDQEECVSVRSAVAFARSIGAIPAYAYLGDVGESPTGDKKAEKFEDEFLDDLVPGLADIGFQAVAYMPPRNTRAQLARVGALAAENGLLQISGVDINSSRQSFNCPELRLPEFRHLADSTWALVGHERLSALGEEYGIFHPGNPLAALPLSERVARYAEAGRALAKDREADITAVLRMALRK